MADPIRPAARPTASPFWRGLMRVTGTAAILLFLTPAFFVVKYYAVDQAREAKIASAMSVAPITPPLPVDTVAPPLAPPAPGNAALWYSRAIQLYTDQLNSNAAAPSERWLLPTSDEARALFEGARRAHSRFFEADPQAKPDFIFHDPDLGGAPAPYRYPVTSTEKYKYLGAAVGLARSVARAAASAPAGDSHQRMIGQTLVRFGNALGAEHATRTHLAVSVIVQKTGLALLLPFGGEPLRRYVDSLATYDDAVQDKYRRLEFDTPDNLLLQGKVLRHDADPMWRREAVWAMQPALSRPQVMLSRPVETMTAKATLADAAAHDPDPSVRAAANAALGEIAQHGAVIRR